MDTETADAHAPDTETPPPDEYAIVEIFGHRRHVGRILEVDRFGAKMLRIDVPKDGKFENGYATHFYGGSSIFSMTPCDRATVERAGRPYQAAGMITHEPIDEPENHEDEDVF